MDDEDVDKYEVKVLIITDNNSDVRRLNEELEERWRISEVTANQRRDGTPIFLVELLREKPDV